MRYNARKARKMMLWVAQRLALPEMPYVWAVMYLAERQHLAKTGRWILWDSFVAMRQGPAPLRTLAELHQGVSQWPRLEGRSNMAGWLQQLAIRFATRELEDVFTKLEVDCMEHAYWDANRLGFAGIERLVKGEAWRLADLDGLLDPLEVAKEGGAGVAELQHILRWREPPPLVEVMHLCATVRR